MDVGEFIARWRVSEASERANKDSFLKELCRVLQVPEPDAKTGDPERDQYVFEASAVLLSESGRPSIGSMDLYKRGAFVLEAKQGSSKGKKIGTARRGTPGWNVAMTDAAGQAFGYAKTLDDPPPFVIVADIGECFDLYACFDGTGAYRAFPNAQKNRIFLRDLVEPSHRETLRAIWLEPMSLDPRRFAARVTQHVAARLADLAKELEVDGHAPALVARFLMRCLFTMFVEDIKLLPDNIFTRALERNWLPDPTSFKDGVEELWAAMNAGKRFFLLGKLLRFNGGLFAEPVAIPLSQKQLYLLYEAAECNWADVEPAIFGTLIERALDPVERHRLGAHFTPRAYVERLLRPALEEPLRAEWDLVRVAVRELVPANSAASAQNVAKAREVVRTFQRRLTTLRVLDPACGSGNFLYVALDIFKRLESDVLGALADLGSSQEELGSEEFLVSPRQFLGIEVRAWSQQVAELVLWIGYLQWHHRTYGGTKHPPEPVLRDYKNVECRDAIIDAHGLPAAWPRADFVVGNPPFLGKLNVKADLGSEYAATLRKAYRGEVADSADFVMYWWHKAARLLAAGDVQRFGFVTTNSITQVFNRRTVAAALDGTPPLHIAYAIPNHPWVDTESGSASVRVAMTVVERERGVGRLTTVMSEGEASAVDGAIDVTLSQQDGVIHANLAIGANVAAAEPLTANLGLTGAGVMLGSRGFLVKPTEKVTAPPSVFKPIVNGNDILQKSRNAKVIDFDGLTPEDAREIAPGALQRVIKLVKPARDVNPRASRRERWWLFSETMPKTRASIAGLKRYIATPETARHRVFTFVDGSVLPEHPLVAIALDDAFHLGVLSSRIHVTWALAAGGRLGIGDDPRYNKTVCFEPFAFPQCGTKQADRIRDLAESIDKHRKRQLASYPKLTITALYKVLAKLRSRTELDSKDKVVHEQGLALVLAHLHDELDAAVADAYGWNRNSSEENILARLVELNSIRRREEEAGFVAWLRPAFQKPLAATAENTSHHRQPVATARAVLSWPSTLPRQVNIIRQLISTSDLSWTAAEVANRYDDASADSVTTALETLEVLGIAASFREGKTRRWKGLARTNGDSVMRTKSSPPSTSGDRTVRYVVPEPEYLMAADSVQQPAYSRTANPKPSKGRRKGSAK